LHRLAQPLGVAVLAAGACGAIWLADPMTPGGLLPVCPMKALFGIDCPGCGSLRMLSALMHGDLPTALGYNAVGVVAVVLSIVAFGTWTWGRVRGRRVRGWQDWRWAPAVALVVTLAWFIVRNLDFGPFPALYV
jgi:Protein of unknown function (DUF2752)